MMAGENFSMLHISNIKKHPDVSDFILYRISEWIWILCPVPILVLGSFGNIMIVIILRRIGSGVTTVFFMALAMSDLLLLYSGLGTEWVRKVWGLSVFALSNATCKVTHFTMYVAGVLSAWLLVSMTAQRAMAVVWPHRVHVICTRRTTLRFIVGTIAFILLTHSHLLYGLELKPVSNHTDHICTYTSAEYGKFMSVVWSWVDLLVFSLVPVTLLFLSNSVLVWKLKASSRDVSISVSKSDFVALRGKKTSSITVTLFIVSITFLFLAMPFSIYLVLEPYYILERAAHDVQFRAVAEFIHIIVNILWYCNSAVNFYLYCLTGTKFRDEFRNIMTLRKKETCTPIRLTELSVIKVSPAPYHMNRKNALTNHEEF